MASSGSTSVTVTSWDTLKFSWSESSQSAANNTTTISWKLQLIAGSSGRIDSSVSKDWSVTVNGTNYSGTNKVAISNNSTITLASGTTTITHNSDGTKSFNYSFSQEFAINFSGSYIGTKSGSGSGTLDTIPRKSTLTASNGTLGTPQMLNINRASSAFTHTITYKCGSATGTVVTKTDATGVSWTPPLSLAQQNKTGTSVSVTLTITTYSGSTNIGSNTKTITCAIPSSVKPSVSISVSDPTGHAGTYGAYLQGLSKINIVVTASGNQGSTIKSYSTTADGMTYTVASVTTGVIKNTGTLTIKTTVTDSRGRTATASTTISVTAYSKPKITSFSVIRSNADGSANSSGSYLAVKFNATVTALNNKNTSAFKIQYKKDTVSEYTTATLSEYANKYSVTNGLYIFAADASSYDVRLIVTDIFDSATKTGVGPSIKKLWSALSKGLGFAFGKIAELENVLDIGFKTRFMGGILPPVLEPNTDLNDILTPNTYTGENVQNYSYANCPVTSGTFTLVVESGGEDGQIKQTYYTCSKYKPERYSRFYYQGTWGGWLWAGTDEYILYDNPSGSAGEITLSYSCAHYRYLEIYYTDNNYKSDGSGGSGGYTKIYAPNGKTVHLQLQEAGRNVYIRQTSYTISGTTITPDVENASYVRFTAVEGSDPVSISTGTNYIKIIRVIGRA